MQEITCCQFRTTNMDNVGADELRIVIRAAGNQGGDIEAATDARIQAKTKQLAELEAKVWKLTELLK